MRDGTDAASDVNGAFDCLRRCDAVCFDDRRQHRRGAIVGDAVHGESESAPVHAVDGDGRRHDRRAEGFPTRSTAESVAGGV